MPPAHSPWFIGTLTCSTDRSRISMYRLKWNRGRTFLERSSRKKAKRLEGETDASAVLSPGTVAVLRLTASRMCWARTIAASPCNRSAPIPKSKVHAPPRRVDGKNCLTIAQTQDYRWDAR